MHILQRAQTEGGASLHLHALSRRVAFRANNHVHLNQATSVANHAAVSQNYKLLFCEAFVPC